MLQASEDIPWPLVEKTTETEAGSLQSVKEHSRADIHTAVQGRCHDTRDKHALKKAAAHREPTQERMHFLSGTVRLGGPMLEHSIPERLYAEK